MMMVFDRVWSGELSMTQVMSKLCSVCVQVNDAHQINIYQLKKSKYLVQNKVNCFQTLWKIVSLRKFVRIWLVLYVSCGVCDPL